MARFNAAQIITEYSRSARRQAGRVIYAIYEQTFTSFTFNDDDERSHAWYGASRAAYISLFHCLAEADIYHYLKWAPPCAYNT